MAPVFKEFLIYEKKAAWFWCKGSKHAMRERIMLPVTNGVNLDRVLPLSGPWFSEI